MIIKKRRNNVDTDKKNLHIYYISLPNDEYENKYTFLCDIFFNFLFLSFENVLMNNFKVYFYNIKKKTFYSFTQSEHFIFNLRQEIIKIYIDNPLINFRRKSLRIKTKIYYKIQNSLFLF